MISTNPNVATESRAIRRAATFEDYEQIIDLQSRNGLGYKPYEQWRHLWVNNPAWRKQANWPIGYLLEASGKIVGYVGSIPLAYEFRGKEYTAITGYGVVADPEYRAAMAPMIIRFSRLKADIYMHTSCNPDSAKFHSVFRGLPVPSGAWDRTSFWITNYSGFMSSWLKSKGLPKAAAVAVAPFASAAMRLKDVALVGGKLRRRQGSGASYQICVTTEFDDRFDEFWQKLRTRYSHRLLAVRSQEALNWHFKYALADQRAWIVTAENNSRLLAYAIFYRQDNKDLQLKRLRLIDFQTLDGDTTPLVDMLAWALEHCRNSGIHMLETIGLRRDKQELVASLAPYHRQLPAWMFYYRGNSEELRIGLEDPEVWDPSFYDGDATL